MKRACRKKVDFVGKSLKREQTDLQDFCVTLASIESIARDRQTVLFRSRNIHDPGQRITKAFRWIKV